MVVFGGWYWLFLVLFKIYFTSCFVFDQKQIFICSFYLIRSFRSCQYLSNVCISCSSTPPDCPTVCMDLNITVLCMPVTVLDDKKISLWVISFFTVLMREPLRIVYCCFSLFHAKIILWWWLLRYAREIFIGFFIYVFHVAILRRRNRPSVL